MIAVPIAEIVGRLDIPKDISALSFYATQLREKAKMVEDKRPE
jgi:hypothetical protein